VGRVRREDRKSFVPVADVQHKCSVNIMKEQLDYWVSAHSVGIVMPLTGLEASPLFNL